MHGLVGRDLSTHRVNTSHNLQYRIIRKNEPANKTEELERAAACDNKQYHELTPNAKDIS
jgi:hypothetical protein